MKARTPEQTVTLRFDADNLRIIHPTGGTGAEPDVCRPHGNAHVRQLTTGVGRPDAVPTQPASFPMVHGQPAAQLAHIQQ